MKKKNMIARNSAIAVLLLAVLLFIPTIVAAAPASPSPSGTATASAPGTGDTDSSSDAPDAGDTDSSAGDNPGDTGDTDSSAGTPPGTGDTDSSGGTPPGTDDTDSSAGGTPPPTGDTDSSAGDGDDGNGDNGGNGGGGDTGNGGGSSGSRSGSRSGGVFIAQTANVVSAIGGNCPLITKYMKRGWANDPVQVSKLQAFLKNNEGLDVDVNGIFDQKTENAVRAFQTKYAETVLLPWGGRKTSGMVYITTSKKINELACAQPLMLTASELSIINAFRAKLGGSATPTQTGTVMTETEGTPTTTPVETDGAMEGEEFGTATGTDTNVASASEASILVRFWRFIVNLFR